MKRQMPNEVPTPPTRVGVREVARAAGVSTQTVSRVINQHANIRPETRERVLEAMTTLGYRMNNAARSLGTRTTRTIGVIASDATLYGPSVGIAALDAAALEAGRWIATAYADAADAGSILAAADRLLAQGVDGIVILAPHVATLATLRSAHPGFPLTALHSGAGAEAQSRGAALIVAHLVSLGHRRIARIAGPDEWLEARARETGFLRAIAEAGVVEGARWSGRWRAVDGAALAGEVARAVRAVDGPTAIAVANDQMALGLMAGLREVGLDVPGEVSVAGFDDNPDAAFYVPALTTVSVDIEREARRAVAAVLERVAVDDAVTDDAILEPVASDLDAGLSRLVVRASTGAPR